MFLQMLFIMIPHTSIMAVDSCINTIAEDSLITHQLDEVIVKSQYHYAKRKGDKFVVSFKNSPFYEGKTLAEGLGMCPLITRQGEAFQILGKASSVIYINGRPSTLSGEDLIAFLNSKNINEVDHVEIITMPTGKFAEANKSGVINIVIAQNSKLGTMGIINAETMKGHNFGVKTNGMFAFGLKNMNINVFANYVNQKKERESTAFYDFSNKENIQEVSEFSQHGRPFTTTGSIEWRGKNNLLGCSYTYSLLLIDADYCNSATDALSWIKNTNSNNHYNTLQVYDDWSFAGNTINFLYSWYDRRNKTDDIFTASEMANHSDRANHTINNIKLNIASNLSDNWKIEYGGSVNHLRMCSNFSYDNWKNSANYKENVWKAYILTSKQLGRWSIDAGISFEHTKQNFVGNQKTYDSWLPNVNITRKNNWGLLYCLFSMTMERIPYSCLTLSPIYFSPQSMTIGNPELQPEKDYNLNLGISKGNLNIEMFYKKYKNAYTQYSYTDNGRIVNGYINLDDENQYGLNISYSHAISTILLGKIEASSYLDYSQTLNSGTNMNWNNYLSTSLSIRLDKKKRFDAEVSYWALFPQKERGIEWKNRACFNMAVNYNVIPSVLRIAFNINDLFNQNFAYFSRKHDNVNVVNKNKFDNRKAVFAVRYTLSNKKRVGRNQQKTIDDLERIPTE